MTAEWTVAFLLGLFSSTHCLGMCGGIAGALTFSLAPEVRQHPQRLPAFNLAYNAGRIGSYTIAGGLAAGGAGAVLASLGASDPLVMGSLGALSLTAVGLHIAGWFPRFARIETLGRPLWQHLEPLGRRLLPVRRLPHAYAFGMVWGWLPCGLVYAALAYSLTTESAWRGALFMGFFGLGTLPMLFTVGVMASHIVPRLRTPAVRRLAGVLIIGLAPLPLALAHWEDIMKGIAS
ncbi:sulfite exporter TauE/SafE family protein [Halomonas faecis]|uniref:sulfite exporter TauE/SafE family protein n=1 Tax=Halomonas faecis TaxID=1562110 RepID=UPI0013D80F22|nr:sulfite exporter TauE/SafE family protein [Halomonas faecis]